MTKRKKVGAILIGVMVVLGLMMVSGAYVWAHDKANLLLAVFVILLYGIGQWITVKYWQSIQEDWEATGEILGRMQQAITDIPAALDSNLKSIATRLSENQQKALSELQSQVNEGARKTLETGASLIGESISKNFKAPVDSLKVLLDTWEAKTREQADRIRAMAEAAADNSAKAASQGTALIAESLDKNLRAPIAALQASLAEDRQVARAEAEGAKALWEELRRSQQAWSEKGESLAASVTEELKSLAAEGALAAEEGRKAWGQKAAEVQASWDRRAQALEEKMLASLRSESESLGSGFAAAAGTLAKSLESQVASLQGAASVFEEGLGKIREASAALIRDVQSTGDAGRTALIEEFSAAQKQALSEASRLLEAQGQIGLETASKVSDLAAGLGQGSRDLQELAHISQINQAEMQAAVGMLNAGLAAVLERLDSQAKAGEGYEHFLADLGRALASFQERAAETLVENALKTQEILMEVLERSEGKAANRPESEVASLT